MTHVITLSPAGPYNLDLSLKIFAAFSPRDGTDGGALKLAVRIAGTPAVIEVRQTRLEPVLLRVSSSQRVDAHALKEVAAWIVLADLDLTHFYDISRQHPTLGPITTQLNGLKYLRPASIFEMAVIAVTEQQISLSAARSIRQRLVERFGLKVDGLWVFPEPRDLAGSSIDQIISCGLSRKKAEYIKDLADSVFNDTVNLNALKSMNDDEARVFISGMRGFGRWSANYILIRGLGRTDAVPADDLGVRTVLGHYLGSGSRMTAEEVEHALESFRPYRGLATFYFLAHSRLATAPGS
ncbi:MAG: hypothetical protein L7F78_02535 [Syntrophales bacterium LBB04]|nr:hypothetical protein [Syntrophales bacterium LBB04]